MFKPRRSSHSARFKAFSCALAGLSLVTIVVTGLTSGCARKVEAPKITPRYATIEPKKVPDFLKDTIFERIDVGNTEPFLVSGYGLIVNLNGTGDNTAVPTRVREYMIKQMVKHGYGQYRVMGYEKIQPEDVLKDKRTAVVQVMAFLPPGARRDQRIDVAVRALPESYTSSLAGGSLYRTELRINGANPRSPEGAVNNWAIADGGQVFVNPAYALENPKDTSVKASLRTGMVLDSGKVTTDRPVMFRLRQPQLSMSRAIETRINEAFGATADVQSKSKMAAYVQAEAFDEGIVQVYVPRSFNGDWERFVGVATHLYLNGSPEFSARKARELVEVALQPDAPLLDVSYCWEALGARSLPYIVPLMAGEHGPDVAYAAARAAAYIGEPAAQDVLAGMALEKDHPFQLPAVQVLGNLSPSPRINSMLRRLLDSNQTLVRIEAYKVLARNRDPIVLSKVINENFVLDMVPSKGPPLVYATRGGTPRIAVIGDRSRVDTPLVFSAMDNQLTITSDQASAGLTIFYRNPYRETVARVQTGPDLAELIAHLGGQTTPGDPPLSFTFGDIVAILQRMSKQKQIVAGVNRVESPFVLQEANDLMDEIYGAPAIPDLGRPTEDKPTVGKIDEPVKSEVGTAR